MATRAKAASPPKKPAGGKPKAAAPGKPMAIVKAIVATAKRAKPAAPQKSPAAAKAAKPVKPRVSEDQRRHYIEVAAYYIAERRGFFGASVLEDWTQAEAEVDRMLREGKLNP